MSHATTTTTTNCSSSNNACNNNNNKVANIQHCDRLHMPPVSKNKSLKEKVNQSHTGQKGFEGSQLQKGYPKSSTVAVTRTTAATTTTTIKGQQQDNGNAFHLSMNVA